MLREFQPTFDAGEAAALDPDSGLPATTDGPATTTLQSPWLHLRCRVCAHTFRPGDAVAVAADGTVVHASVALPCAGNLDAPSDANPEAAAFFDGLDETWPPPKQLQIVRLTPDHYLVAPPHAGFKRRTCAVCGHTFRPLDHVVICPCFPERARCQVAIHRDVVHGLHCYDDWNPGDYKLHCPATSRLV